MQATTATTAAPTSAPTTAAAVAGIGEAGGATVTTLAAEGGSINDTASTRTVNRIIMALVVLAAVLAAVTFWFWRATAPLNPALEGLEMMSSNQWWRASPTKREQLLAKVHSGRGPIDERFAGSSRRPVGTPSNR
jgi:hypothetical protein